MFESTGVATREMVMKTFPTKERLEKGSVAVIECYKEIPCNPCATACRQDAIKTFVDINDLPTLDHERCNGCTLCMVNCPGLAIVVVDKNYTGEDALFKIPFEFKPLPLEGDIVRGLNRAGEHICDVEVVKIQNPKSFDQTAILSLLVKKEYLYDFITIEVGVK
ncbi:MAG: 4Fe-4S ferredoxin [Alkaliphilus sp.]|nr:4Fe-4S binding protein [bacterium AH-315-L21]MBN4062873.1 4Fe-4S binding protein [Alkaliphilus sp. AH-315-G20]MBN4067826.1 4Fe-4S binding protein [Alkaliphilus transvaalensis]MBN4069699.1 4Fe-4S binding protein [bacterium AH-315-G05]PHS29833.1 MAG: 4Fe-4S ferredoxin [Alkaliphilus sp.]